MAVLLAVMLVSSLLVIYLIWAGGGLAVPVQKVEPILSGIKADQVLVRSPERNDIEAILRISGDPQAMAVNGWSAKTQQDFADLLRSPGEPREKGCFLVAVEPTGDIVGYISLSTRPSTKGELSIGISVAQSAAGKGVGTGLMRYSIATLQEVHDGPVWVGTATDNAGVQKIMERLGFSPEPGIVPYESPNGQSLRSVWYEVGKGTRPPR